MRYLRSFALLGGLLVLLAACSSGQPTSNQQPPTGVIAVQPKRQTFHTRVSGLGQLAADSRHALSISLPRPTQVVATEVLAGQRVERGQMLLKLATDPATRKAYLQAQSALKVTREDLARTERLHAQKLATNAQLDAARKALADAQAAFAAQAELGGAQPVTTLTAPANGVITALPVQSGQRVAAGATLIQFAPAAALAAQLGVEPAAAAGIRVGMPVMISPVYDSGRAPPLHGTVAMVGAAVNPQTHLVDVVATLDGRPPLVAGAALSAAILTSDYQAWAVPRNALQTDAKGDYVFQIEHGKANRVDVKALSPDGSPVGVDGLLDPDAPVITLGSYEISDGDPVQAQAPGSGSTSGGLK